MYGYGSPYYGGGSFNPLLHSSYLPERQYYPGRPQHDPYAEARARAQAGARARSLAEQRARRARWLPDEDEDDEYDWQYNQLGPRERAYLEARKRQQQLEQQQREREREELERKRRAEEERWQRQLELKQREEDARRQRILEEQRRVQQRKREEARKMAEAANARENGQHRIPSSPRRVPISDGVTPSPKPQTKAPSPAPAPCAPTPKSQYTEKHEEAATTIQTHYRIHRSLKSICDFENSFQDAKHKFTFPTTLDFQRPSAGEGHEHDHIPVPVRSPPPPKADDSETTSAMDVDEQFSGKLAYTSNNYALHAYLESLLKLLMQLDGVQSWGNAGVREKRRAVVKDIEAEVRRVDSYWKNAWRDHLKEAEQAKAGTEEGGKAEDKAMEEKMEIEDSSSSDMTNILV